MNKRFALVVCILSVASNSLFASRNSLHNKQNAWRAPILEDHVVKISAHHVSVASDAQEGAVTITRDKNGLWRVRGDRPGMITLLIQKKKQTHPHEYQYRVVEPHV